jgi:hypothetical protein
MNTIGTAQTAIKMVIEYVSGYVRTHNFPEVYKAKREAGKIGSKKYWKNHGKPLNVLTVTDRYNGTIYLQIGTDVKAQNSGSDYPHSRGMERAFESNWVKNVQISGSIVGEEGIQRI